MARQGFQLEDFNLVETISKGSFGTVYKAVRKDDGRVYAMKQVKLKGMKRVDREEAIDEARMLSQLSHPYITQYHGSYIDKDEQLSILMEYAANGSLHRRIRAPGANRTLPEATVWKYIIQALLGLDYIHRRKIIHRDIKSLNLFLDAGDNIKIGDLGIARSLGDNSDFARTIVGTPFYLSPELCDDKPYNEKSDVWALGVVLYECCMGRYPFEAQNEGALIRKILKGQYSPITGPYSPTLIQVATSMLTFNPSRRPTAAQLLQTPAVINQARELGIDMSCKKSVAADPPVFDQQAVNKAADKHLSDEPGCTHAGSAAVRMQEPASQNQQQQQQQQAAHRPKTSGRPQLSAGAHISAGKHPFDLPQQQPRQQPGSWQQQKCSASADSAVNLQRKLAVETANKVPQPEQLVITAVQQRPGSACQPAPFALTAGRYGQMQQSTSAQEAASSVWSVKPTLPQYGRKRCPDLMATGPSLRGGPGGGVRGGAVNPVADDATSYCTTSYQPTSYH